MVCNQSPDLIIPHLSEFDEFLDPATCNSVLQIFLSLINNDRISTLTGKSGFLLFTLMFISGQLIPIRRAAQKANCSQHNLLKMVQIVAAIARHSEQLRSVSISDIVCIFCPKLTGQILLNALREVESVAELFP